MTVPPITHWRNWESCAPSARIWTAIDLPRNRGKAYIAQKGVLRVREIDPDAEWIGWWDADLSTPLEEVDAMLRYVAGSQ